MQYKIVTAPSKGTLDRPVGTWFTGSQVKYTPRLGQSGADSFTYAAAGSTTPLRLTGSGARAARWSVDAIPGGSATVGTISRDGVYRAPARPPRGRDVTIRALGATGQVARTVIRIVPAAPRRAAPSVTAAPAPRVGLSALRLARHRDALIAAVTADQPGRVRFVATRDGLRIGSCSAAARRGTAATCRITLPRSVAPQPFVCAVPRTSGLDLPGVRVTVLLAPVVRHR